jgi:hypothetical protein
LIRFLLKRFLGLIIGGLICLLSYGLYKEHPFFGFIIAFFGGMFCMFVIWTFMKITKRDGLG